MRSIQLFDRNVDELQHIFSFLKSNWASFGVEMKDQLDMELSVEELFMNMIRHNNSTDGKITLSVEKKGRQILLSLTDHEKVPFDITSSANVDFDKYLKNMKPGGLGIHLVKELMDDITFEHQQGVSTITIKKII